MTNTQAILNHDPHQAHRDRMRELQQRFERAHSDDARDTIQGLMDAQNARYAELTKNKTQIS